MILALKSPVSQQRPFDRAEKVQPWILRGPLEDLAGPSKGRGIHTPASPLGGAWEAPDDRAHSRNRENGPGTPPPGPGGPIPPQPEGLEG